MSTYPSCSQLANAAHLPILLEQASPRSQRRLLSEERPPTAPRQNFQVHGKSGTRHTWQIAQFRRHFHLVSALPGGLFYQTVPGKINASNQFFCSDQELLLAKGSEILIVKVYYADTDAGGVVYYANYLRWFEMDRSEFLEERDVSVAEYARQGYLFAVAHLEIDYLVSAVLGDKLEIRTEIERVRHVRFFVRQSVVRCSDGELLASARLSLACLSPEGKITAMPKSLVETLKSAIPADGQE